MSLHAATGGLNPLPLYPTECVNILVFTKGLIALNLVLDVEKGKKGSLVRTHKKSLKVINSASEKLDLIDPWRVLNPDSSRFTWRQKKAEIQCRLDFFLINQCTFCNNINAETLAGYKTDHSMITLQISLHSNTRGRGFWKLNTSF